MQKLLTEKILMHFHMNYLCICVYESFTLIKKIRLKENFSEGKNVQEPDTAFHWERKFIECLRNLIKMKHCSSLRDDVLCW